MHFNTRKGIHVSTPTPLKRAETAKSDSTAGKYGPCLGSRLAQVALSGMTAKEWRDTNPGREGNIRDYAT